MAGAILASGTQLGRTLDTVLAQEGDSVLADLTKSHDTAQADLVSSRSRLNSEYERIISDANKEADKIGRQVIGGAELRTRNEQLRLVEGAIDRVFADATKRIAAAPRDKSYSDLLASLLLEATSALGTTDVIVSTSDTDAEAVSKHVGGIKGAEMSDKRIECIGGVHVKARSGSTAFDNTLDAKIKRVKPLIKKEIATRFGLGRNGS